MKSISNIPESVLSRIWEEQHFQPDSLKTLDGVDVQVIRRGWRNSDNGPDFKQALIRIADQVYEGDIELHLIPGDWHTHGHDTDPSYNHTILHVALWPPQQTTQQLEIVYPERTVLDHRLLSDDIKLVLAALIERMRGGRYEVDGISFAANGMHEVVEDGFNMKALIWWQWISRVTTQRSLETKLEFWHRASCIFRTSSADGPPPISAPNTMYCGTESSLKNH